MSLLLSTWSFGTRGHAIAWPALERGGSALDATVEVARVVEADPEIDSVGVGGLPDSDGMMSFDACVMTSPARIGSVCAVEGHPHVADIARHVMERSTHSMLAGPGAARFAESNGAAPTDALTERARTRWETWQRTGVVPNQVGDSDLGLRPYDRGGGALFEDESRWSDHDTIGVLAIDDAHDMAGACTTSGTPFKHPGRVGDSPIVGHGLYVDPSAGAAVATGEGELIMGVCGSFLAVERMRAGATPLEAIMHVLERIESTYDLLAHHQVALIAVTPDGEWSSAALRPGYRTSVSDAEGTRAIPHEAVLLEGT